jgi:hypothetical protein
LSSVLSAGGSGSASSAITRAGQPRTSSPPPASQPANAPCNSAGGAQAGLAGAGNVVDRAIGSWAAFRGPARGRPLDSWSRP